MYLGITVPHGVGQGEGDGQMAKPWKLQATCLGAGIMAATLNFWDGAYCQVPSGREEEWITI